MTFPKSVWIALASITCSIVVALLLGDLVPTVPKAFAVAVGAGFGAWVAIIKARPKS